MKGLRSKIEIIVIGVFILLFLIWAASKCSSSKEKLQQAATEEAREDSLVNASKQPAPTANVNPSLPVLQPAATNPSTAQPSTAPATGTQPAATSTKPQDPQYTRLFVTIDKLKIRKQPGLKGDVLGELKLFDEVYFMNEETDSTYKVNLGIEIADEPYVKIKTKKGTVGWVYGAGVHYARKKRSGVLE